MITLALHLSIAYWKLCRFLYDHFNILSGYPNACWFLAQLDKFAHSQMSQNQEDHQNISFWNSWQRNRIVHHGFWLTSKVSVLGPRYLYQIKLFSSLLWRHNGCDVVSNHQPHDCLLNRSFRRRSNKTPKPRVTGHLCEEFTGDRIIPRTNGQ